MYKLGPSMLFRFYLMLIFFVFCQFQNSKADDYIVYHNDVYASLGKGYFLTSGKIQQVVDGELIRVLRYNRTKKTFEVKLLDREKQITVWITPYSIKDLSKIDTTKQGSIAKKTPEDYLIGLSKSQIREKSGKPDSTINNTWIYRNRMNVRFDQNGQVHDVFFFKSKSLPQENLDLQYATTRKSFNDQNTDSEELEKIVTLIQSAYLGQNKQSNTSKEIYLGVGTGHWIQEKSTNGSIIILEDNSIWSVNGIDTIYSQLWLPLTEITVIENRNLYSYWLINTDDGEKVAANYLGQK